MTTPVDEDLVIKVADLYIFTEGTCRSVAKHLGISKSTVHNYLRNKLKTIDPDKYSTVATILDNNRNDAPYRGGLSTKRKSQRKSNRR